MRTRTTVALTFTLLACTDASSPRTPSRPHREPSEDASTSDGDRPDTAADGGWRACRDDRPPPGLQWRQGGSSCTLPDGGPGIGKGSYGCVDPFECHCKPEGGFAECERPAQCVYASCSGANEGDFCRLKDGSRGRCCAGTCRTFEFLTSRVDNCGGCGMGCGVGEDSCKGGNCGDCGAGALCTCDGVNCGAGRTCVETDCNGGEFIAGTCHACVIDDCASKPDGTRCTYQRVPKPYSGICCSGQCIQPQYDNENCGGCGIRCCEGTACGPANWFPGGACHGPLAEPDN